MVRQERDRRGPEHRGNPQEPGRLGDFAENAPTEARRDAARKLFEGEERAQAKRDNALVRPGFRERVEQLVQGQWREPVIVLRLDEGFDLAFEVPGRRTDGSVEGTQPIRHSLRQVGRGLGVVGAIGAFIAAGGPTGGGGKRKGTSEPAVHVSGPANAMALDLVDRFRSATGPWLACSPSSIAVVDTGRTYLDPKDAGEPRIVWQARKPHAPDLSFRTRTITWPDGSTFKFPLHGRSEEQHLRQYHEAPDTIHWHGRPSS